MPQRLLKLHYTFETKELTKKHLVANIFLLVNWPRSVIFEYLNVGVIKTFFGSEDLGLGPTKSKLVSGAHH